MNIHADLKLISKFESEYLIKQLIKYCNSKESWIYDKKSSDNYTKDFFDSKGCILVYQKQNRKVYFAFYENGKNQLALANIVPYTSKIISTIEYNTFINDFAKSFRAWDLKNCKGIKLKVSKTDLELKDIISAKIPRKKFRFFLRTHPFTFHPNDINRLDKFICAHIRYARKSLNLTHLKQYLIVKKHWSDSNVSWCIERINIGLDIINEYKKR